MKIVIYTCVAGRYDEKIYEVANQCCIDECFLFTNDVLTHSAGWYVKKLAMPSSITRPDLVNRYHKFFPHLLPFKADMSIYMDGNFEVKKDIGSLIKKFLQSKKTFGCLKHPQRENILQEADACKFLGKFKDNDKTRVSKQIKFYFNDGFPMDSHLQSAGILFRRHDNLPLLHDAMSLWWGQINTYTARDQISLPYVLWKTQLPFMSFDLNIFDNEYFERHLHRQKESLITRLKRTVRSEVRRFGRLVRR